jgi:hypothetical protein
MDVSTLRYDSPVRGSVFRCSSRNPASTRFLAAPSLLSRTFSPKEPSASMNPASQALPRIGDVSGVLVVIEPPVSELSQLIISLNRSTFGVRR